MTLAVEDPSLTPPRPPAALPRLGEQPPLLALAGTCEDRPFLVEGRRAAVVGDERRGGCRAWLDGTLVAEIEAGEGTYVNAVRSPGLVRREWVGGGVTRTDSLLVAPALPLVVLQLGAPAAVRPETPELTVTLRLLPGAAGVRYRMADAADAVVLGGRDPAAPVVALGIVPPAEILSLEADPSGGCRVRVTTSPEDAPTLLLARAPAGQIQKTFDAGGHLPAHERGASTADDDGLVSRSGVPEIDEAVGWARRRLAVAAERPGAGSFDRTLWTGLGALAAADEESARLALARMEEVSEPGSALLAARLALTLGDSDAARRRVLAQGPELLERAASSSGPDRLLWALALEELADALRYAAPEEELDRLREVARTLGAEPSGGVRLPMVGGGAAAGARHPLEPLLRPGAGALPSSTLEEVAAWSAFARGDAVAGYTLWREALTRGLAGGPAGRGTWDRADEPGAPLAGSLLATLVHGLLGWMPDAPVGRATLAPRLPAHLLRFAVTGLPLGGGRVRFGFSRSADGRVRYEVEATEGRAPPMLVFAPRLPFPEVGEATLDGEPVAVEAGARGGASVQLQIPLDRPRVFEAAPTADRPS